MPSINISPTVIVVILGTVILLALVLFIVLFLFFFSRKQGRYDMEMIQSQMEIQNLTLQKVGEELHDNVGQLLTLALLHLNALEQKDANFTDSPEFQKIYGVLQTTIKAVRGLSKALDSETVELLGLKDIVQLEVDKLVQLGKFEVDFRVTGIAQPLPKKGDIVLFRMIQELLNNTLKHAKATHIGINIDYKEETLYTTIKDDGQGFSLPSIAEKDPSQLGMGLRNLVRRANLLGGSCTILSRPGEGTKTEIVVPLV